MVKYRLKGLLTHAKKYSFWSAVVAALAAFTIVYLVFRVRDALETKKNQ